MVSAAAGDESVHAGRRPGNGAIRGARAARATAAPAVVAPAETAAPQAGPAAGRLLVVDDNENNRDMLSRRLEQQDYAVADAEDGRQALDRSAAAPSTWSCSTS